MVRSVGLLIVGITRRRIIIDALERVYRRTDKPRRPLRPTMRQYAKLLGETLTAILMLVALAKVAVGGPLDDANAADDRGDYKTVYRLLRPLADQGNATAQARIGLMYHEGDGVPKDYAEAARWLRMAAEQGYGPAQAALGAMYVNGEGVPRDLAEGIRWLRNAAEQGLSPVQETLGEMYSVNSKNVPQDYAEAAKWFRKAADQGDPTAQYNLGTMYIEGKGVLQDYVQAHMWLNLSVSRLPASEKKIRDEAVHNRDLVAAKMTPEQIAEAQKLAREWKPKPER
jgi:TPR repeat protein